MGAVAVGLLAGAVADRVAGDPRRGHPVAAFGSVAAALERRAWRPTRTAGAAHVLALVGGATVAAALADRRLRRRPAARALLVAATTWTALGGRSLALAGRELAGAVRAGDLERARRLAPTLVGRDPGGLDAAELCRAAVESVADNTADAVVGPLLWGALAGPAGVAAYRAANTLDAMVGHRSPRYLRFGWAAARLDDVLTWPAARLGAALACLLAPAVGGDRGRARRTLRRDGGAHPSPNAGRMEAAFAGALEVRLGGRNRYGDRVEERPALGEGPPPGPRDVDRAVRLSLLVGAAATALLAAAAAGREAAGRSPAGKVAGAAGKAATGGVPATVRGAAATAGKAAARR
jgi:adenosylcobinamide-phosphate synthase